MSFLFTNVAWTYTKKDSDNDINKYFVLHHILHMINKNYIL